MSDSEIRDAERAYRASGAPQDGEAYVQAVLRSTGLNSTFLIARVIETQRAIAALIGPSLASGHAREVQIRGPSLAFSRPVTPDDMVSFLRGGREWLNPPPTVQVVTSYVPVSIEAAPGGGFSTRGHGAVEEVLADQNAHLPHQRGVPAGSAILCNHANENPGHCPCEPDCYCRQLGHTCSDVSEVYARHDGRDVECRLCSRGAQWQFRQAPRLHVCALHLAECRVNRERGRQESLADIVQHHEVADGDVRPQDAYVEMMQRSSAHMDALNISRMRRRCGNCDKLMDGEAIYCSASCAHSDA